MFALESQNWRKYYQNLCKTRQLKVALVRVLFHRPKLGTLDVAFEAMCSWFRFPKAFQCTWPTMKAVQALPVACRVWMPNVRGRGWWREFAGSVSGQPVQRSLCHIYILALPSLSCRTLPFYALNFGELYHLDLFVCSVTDEVSMGSNLWSP